MFQGTNQVLFAMLTSCMQGSTSSSLSALALTEMLEELGMQVVTAVWAVAETRFSFS